MSNWKGHFIDGNWDNANGKELFEVASPIDDKVYWVGYTATSQQIARAVEAATRAFPVWDRMGFDERCKFIEKFCDKVRRHEEELATEISLATGKPLWEARTEVGAVIGKFSPSIEAYNSRAHETRRLLQSNTSVTRFRPHGVVAVLGPYNFPAHMPNGHIMPALIAGNTVILKQSEKTPKVAELIVDLWKQAGLPPGVLNLLQGGGSTASELIQHLGVKAIFFTGSRRAGLAIANTVGSLGKVVALEMGGNNPIIVWECSNYSAANYNIVQSAYITAGQRCSSARRLIVSKHDDEYVKRLVKAISGLRIDSPYSHPEPFLGPLIDKSHVDQLIHAQAHLESKGGIVLVRAMRREDLGSAYVTPCLIDVTNVPEVTDDEIFGPFLQLKRVETFTDALKEANQTNYGLAAGLISDNSQLYEEFITCVQAGVVNFNQPLVGASALAPFGGIKFSGNGHASGYFAVDYCNYPVGSLESEKPSLPTTIPSGIDVDLL